MPTYNWVCPVCDLRIEVPTIEQLQRDRSEHVKVEHPEHLDEVAGCTCKPVLMIDSRCHYGAEDVAWAACRLCGERAVIHISRALYPTYEDAIAAVEAVADVFSLAHFARHRDELGLRAECPQQPSVLRL